MGSCLIRDLAFWYLANDKHFLYLLMKDLSPGPKVRNSQALVCNSYNLITLKK